MQVLSVSDLSPRFYLLCVYSMQKKVFLQWIKVGGMSENQTQGRSLSDIVVKENNMFLISCHIWI